MVRLLKAINSNLHNYGFRENFLFQKTVRGKAEAFNEFEVLAAVDTGGGEHVVGDGSVCAALEGAFAVVAQNAAAAREADECLRVDKSVNGHDAAEFVVRELRKILVGRARDGVQYVHRRGLDAEFAEIEAHVDSVFHGFAEAHDAAAADFKASGKRVLERTDFIVVGVRGAHVRKVPAVGFQVVVEAGEARLLELVELLAVQESCRKAYGKFGFFLEASNGFANLFYVAVRERASRGDYGVARDACGFFLLRVFDDFVGAEELVFGGTGVVVAALGAVLAVLGAAAAAGVHDRAEVKIVTVELFADFICCLAKLVEIFAEQVNRLFAIDFVTA